MNGRTMHLLLFNGYTQVTPFSEPAKRVIYAWTKARHAGNQLADSAIRL